MASLHVSMAPSIYNTDMRAYNKMWIMLSRKYTILNRLSFMWSGHKSYQI